MRLPSENRRAVILSSAVTLANEQGLAAVSFEAVAHGCKVKTTARNVRSYFPTVVSLWREVVLDDRSSQLVRDDAIAMGVR